MGWKADHMSQEDNSASGVEKIGLTIAACSCAVLAVGSLLDLRMLFLLAAAAVISIVMWQVCDPFSEASQWIGKHYKIPGSVRGATLDAIASSMPELFSGIFFVWIAFQADDKAHVGSEGFGSTIATCAGSAVYNMILIPASVALVVSFRRKKNPIVQVEREVVKRDGLWFLVCEAILLFFLYRQEIQWWASLVFGALYFLYVMHLRRDARRYRKETGNGQEDGGSNNPDQKASVLFGCFEIRLSVATSWLIILVATILVATACYFLVEVTRETAVYFKIPTFFVAVILAAAVSSVPDTLISIGSAMRGDDGGAVSNAFGSNIFDICICLSIPLVIGSYLMDWEPVSLQQDGKPIPGLMGLCVLLWILTAVTLFIIWHKRQVTRGKAILLCGLYLVFVAWAVMGSLEN